MEKLRQNDDIIDILDNMDNCNDGKKEIKLKLKIVNDDDICIETKNESKNNIFTKEVIEKRFLAIGASLAKLEKIKASQSQKMRRPAQMVSSTQSRQSGSLK